ncbi:restriction endonuclease [Ramlibacter sp. RBP-2]|uniref:Restriction endonuclease n=1 Tax=Ramlibacter lithotrophicus TaxID=2606681 RepID=A0A7X6DHV1_9BURK|nr:restriction endonuclease [Ramlibacter lithotrophicus]NKE67323.1 restriction endonuclease [Ramlibacter lithotrophicus]
MGRRKSTPAEDFMDLVAMMPWWAGVALALVSYLVLHQMAGSNPSPNAAQPGQMAAFATRAMVASLASIGQFLIPFFCLLGALGSFFRRQRRESLVRGVVRSKGADALNGMSWREFEMLVGEAFRLQGYRVTEQGGGGADGGVDLVLRRADETYLVQCKQWKAFKVDVKVVRELYGLMAAQGAAGGFVVTSGTFTADAHAFAKGRNVNLVDGPKLFGLIQQATAGRSKPSSAPSPTPAARTAAAATPECPQCGASMVRRTARKGANAGAQFWGCSQYPSCRGTR